MRRLVPLFLALSFFSTGAASAQVPDWVTQVLAAALLPVSAAEARREGVPDSEVRALLNALQNANVRADEARELLDEERADRREHGPVDNFGAFVQSKLQAGLRGRELAAAIRAEHVANGIGNADKSRGNSGAASTARDSMASRGQKGANAAKGANAPGRPGMSKAPGTKGPPATKGRPKPY
jgi:hypothetical protein